MIFDLRQPDGRAQLKRQCSALAGHSEIETLDEDHAALIIRPGWASVCVARPSGKGPGR